LGRSDILILMLQQKTFPSYGYMIHNQWEPATTLWELWDSPEESARPADSRNHIMFGSISSYFYRHLCGIDVPYGNRAFDNITIRPMGIGTKGSIDLNYVHCNVMTPHGQLNVSWTGPLVKGVESIGTTCSVVNETERIYLKCPLKYTTITGTKIATYGGPPIGSCGGGGSSSSTLQPSKKCAADVSKQLNDACIGKQTCSFSCNGGNCSVAGARPSFIGHGSGIPLPDGDPCVGMKKLLAVDITCSPPPPANSAEHVGPPPPPPTTRVTLTVVLPVGSTAAARVPLVKAVGHTISNIVIRSGSDVVWKEGIFVKNANSGIQDGFIDSIDGSSEGVTFLLTGKTNSIGRSTYDFELDFEK
jgi:hypothetical protein